MFASLRHCVIRGRMGVSGPRRGGSTDPLACWMNPPTVFRSRSPADQQPFSYHHHARKIAYWC